MSEPKIQPGQFWDNVDRGSDDECWLWTSTLDINGYGRVWLPETRKRIMAHRVSWEMANGRIPEGLCACHTCDTPACVNPGHLFLGTNDDNIADRVAKGRSARGEKQAASKLTEADVREIRASEGKKTYAQLAEQFGVSLGLVSMVARRERWKHVA